MHAGSEELARVAAAAGRVADDGEAIRQYVTFAVAGEMFAVPMAPVQEIIRAPQVARLPLAPDVLDGLANLRGRVLPIVSLRRLFGCADRANDDATRALVIQLGQPLGFMVDRVASVISAEAGQIESADGIQSIVAAEYLTGVIQREGADGRPEMLLTVDFEKLVAGRFDALSAHAPQRGLLGEALEDQGPAGDDDAGAPDELRLVSFSVAQQEYALDIAAVQEIVQMPAQLSVLPNAPSHVVGMMSLRERLLPLVSLRRLFGLPAGEDGAQQRIVVTTLRGAGGARHVGLVTDAVREVMSVPRALAEPVPQALGDGARLGEFSAICRLDGGRRLVSVIDTARLLDLDGLAEAATLAGPAAGREENPMNPQDEDDTGLDADDDSQLVIFRLGNEEFGVPIMSVQEIVRVPEALTRVPNTPAFVEGVINLRGSVLPVIDQRSRLGLPAIARHEGQRIMVYLLDGVRTGFIVDSVAQVLRIPQAQISPAPALTTDAGQLIGRVANLDGGKRLVLLIDPAHLLARREAQDLGAALAPEAVAA